MANDLQQTYTQFTLFMNKNNKKQKTNKYIDLYFNEKNIHMGFNQENQR